MSNEIHPAPELFSPEQIQTDPILHFFHYAPLPEKLKKVSAPFCFLANTLINTLPRNAERSVALRKLLEAKDAAVRANLPTSEPLTAADREIFRNRAMPDLDSEFPEVKEVGDYDPVRDGPVAFKG
jgi:hypothetical protein